MARVGQVNMKYGRRERGRLNSQWRRRKMACRERVVMWVRRRREVLRAARDLAAFWKRVS